MTIRETVCGTCGHEMTKVLELKKSSMLRIRCADGYACTKSAEWSDPKRISSTKAVEKLQDAQSIITDVGSITLTFSCNILVSTRMTLIICLIKLS